MAAAAIIAMRNAKKKRDEHFDNMTDEQLEELANQKRLEEEEAAKVEAAKVARAALRRTAAGGGLQRSNSGRNLVMVREQCYSVCDGLLTAASCADGSHQQVSREVLSARACLSCRARKPRKGLHSAVPI